MEMSLRCGRMAADGVKTKALAIGICACRKAINFAVSNEGKNAKILNRIQLIEKNKCFGEKHGLLRR